VGRLRLAESKNSFHRTKGNPQPKAFYYFLLSTIIARESPVLPIIPDLTSIIGPPVHLVFSCGRTQTPALRAETSFAMPYQAIPHNQIKGNGDPQKSCRSVAI
jgi:hypothetical protein